MARTDSIYWDEETRRKADLMAQQDRRSRSAFIAVLVDLEWARRQNGHVVALAERVAGEAGGE